MTNITPLNTPGHRMATEPVALVMGSAGVAVGFPGDGGRDQASAEGSEALLRQVARAVRAA